MKRFSEWLSESAMMGTPDAARDYVNAVSNMGYRNPFNEREIVIDDEAAVYVKPWGNKVIIDSIRAFQKKQGIGSRVMRKLTDLADKLQVELFLDPVPFGEEGPGIRKLINFYQHFGFQGGEQGMERKPRTTLKLSGEMRTININPNNI